MRIGTSYSCNDTVCSTSSVHIRENSQRKKDRFLRSLHSVGPWRIHNVQKQGAKGYTPIGGLAMATHTALKQATLQTEFARQYSQISAAATLERAVFFDAYLW